MATKRPASATQRRRSWDTAATEGGTKASAPSQQEQKRRSREQVECAQFLRMKHKLVARPTDTYAKIRLVIRQDEATRKRSLHINGSSKNSKVNTDVSSPLQKNTDEGPAQARPCTARDPPAKQSTENLRRHRVRPQSAKPRNSERATTVAGQQISVELLERTNYYNPIPLTTHLSASRSAPRLQAALKYSSTARQTASSTPSVATAPAPTGRASSSASQPTLFTEETENDSGRRHIVVHMQRMVVVDDDDDDEPTIETMDRRGPQATARSPRVDSDGRPCFLSQRKAWQD